MVPGSCHVEPGLPDSGTLVRPLHIESLDFRVGVTAVVVVLGDALGTSVQHSQQATNVRLYSTGMC